MGNKTVWRKIILGDARGVDKLVAALGKNRHMIDPAAEQIMRTPEFNTGHIASEIALTKVTLKELGLEDGVGYADIFAAAEKAGLKLCPPELGPRLRLAYDQPYEETLVVAMVPIKDEDQLASVFTVHHWDWGQGLGACCCGISDKEDDWHADSEWIFRLSE